MRRNLTFFAVSIVFLTAISLYHSLTITDKNFHLIFCDVGQGDGILIKTPNGNDILVDGGPGDYKMTECLSRHLPFWDREIDAVFLTHPDADHLTGLIEVIRTYNVEYFGMSNAPKSTQVYKELLKVLKDRGVAWDLVVAGDKLTTEDGLAITTLWPTVKFTDSKSTETNDYSLVQYLSYKQFTALLTGDVASVYLNSIMPTVKHINVFKPPHHGSKTGIDEFTFQHNKPQFAVISVGERNKYGHPAPEVLKVLKDNNIPYKDTVIGDVEIVTDGVKWWVKN